MVAHDRARADACDLEHELVTDRTILHALEHRLHGRIAVRRAIGELVPCLRDAAHHVDDLLVELNREKIAFLLNLRGDARKKRIRKKLRRLQNDFPAIRRRVDFDMQNRAGIKKLLFFLAKLHPLHELLQHPALLRHDTKFFLQSGRLLPHVEDFLYYIH